MNDDLVSLQPGTIIGDRYEVVKCLGAGSMGLVYSCKHRELSGHMVAVKVLFPEVAQDKVAAARFRNEIFASYGVSHPNVVRAYEYIRDGDIVAFTMEYVSGGDLADRIGKDELIPINECIRFLSQMCSGVQAIHDAGIIHRDLKPENILLTKEGNVKIADFGIARTGHGPKLTEHGGVVGTIDYVSPEYMLNSQVDWRSDIYAIGILAYEMITGESPFKGDSVYATMTKRLKSDAAPPSSLRRECPEALDVIILRAMARNPEERYQSAQEMEGDLRSITAGYVHPQQATGGNISQQAVAPTARVPQASSGNSIARPIGQKGSTTSGARAPIRPMTPNSQVNPPVGMSERGNLQPSAPNNTGTKIQVLTSNETQMVPSNTMRQYKTDKDGYASLNKNSRMDSVLDKPSWGKPSATREIRIGGGTIDDDRMQRLAHLAARNTRSFWLDGLTIIVAVMIGIGIGCVILKVWFPELLKSKIGLFNIGVVE